MTPDLLALWTRAYNMIVDNRIDFETYIAADTAFNAACVDMFGHTVTTAYDGEGGCVVAGLMYLKAEKHDGD